MDNVGWDDGVCLDINGKVIEIIVVNIFWCRDGMMFIFCLRYVGVAGVVCW